MKLSWLPRTRFRLHLFVEVMASQVITPDPHVVERLLPMPGARAKVERPSRCAPLGGPFSIPFSAGIRHFPREVYRLLMRLMMTTPAGSGTIHDRTPANPNPTSPSSTLLRSQSPMCRWSSRQRQILSLHRTRN